MAAAPSSEYDRALPGNRDKRHKDLIDKAKIEAYMSARNERSEDEDAKHGSKRCAGCKEHWESCERRLCQHGLCDACANKRRQRRLTARKNYADNHYIVRLEEQVDELEYVKKQLAARDATIKELEQKNKQLAHENVLLQCGHYGNKQNMTSTSTYPSATPYQYASVPATQATYGGSQGPSRIPQQPPLPPPMPLSNYQHAGGAYAGASNACPPMPDDILEDYQPTAAKRPYDETDSVDAGFAAGTFPYMN